MLKSFPTRRSATWVGSALVTCAIGALAPSVAHAHFTLDAPPSWMSQDALGSPQKQSPCGNESGGTATGMVTAFQPGQKITLKWTEIIAHDGWFRIALSYKNRADLADPPYALDALGNSTDAGIETVVAYINSTTDLGMLVNNAGFGTKGLFFATDIAGQEHQPRHEQPRRHCRHAAGQEGS